MFGDRGIEIKTPAQIEKMYRLLAVAKYEDRFVVPPAHRELAGEMAIAGERDASRAGEVKTAMQTIGRTVIEVAPNARGEGALPYAATPEVFAPLVACLPPMLFAAHRAELLGEPYFRAFAGGRSIEHGGGISRIRTSELVE